MNGVLIKKRVKCDSCFKESKISNGQKKEPIYAYYTCGKEKLCRECSKARNIV